MEKLRADVARLTREVEHAVEIVEHLQELHASAFKEAEQLRVERDLLATAVAAVRTCCDEAEGMNCDLVPEVRHVLDSVLAELNGHHEPHAETTGEIRMPKLIKDVMTPDELVHFLRTKSAG